MRESMVWIMLKPNRGRYLAELIQGETEINGITIAQPKEDNPKNSKAKVIAVGSPEIKEDKELSIVAKVGDTVHYKQGMGTRYTEIGGRKLVFLRRDHILAREY